MLAPPATYLSTVKERAMAVMCDRLHPGSLLGLDEKERTAGWRHRCQLSEKAALARRGAPFYQDDRTDT